MNRLNHLLSKVAFGAILFFLVASSAAFAQVDYVITGTLDLVSGSDPLGLNGLSVKAKATISQSMAPSSSGTTTTSSTNTYTGVTVTLAGFSCNATPPVTVTLTDNVGAPDTIGINGCDLAGLATVAASVTIPDGNMITAVPANIPLTNVTGSITANLSGSITVFDLTSATIVATGTAPPTVTPSVTSWSPSSTMGSTTPQIQNVTFTTVPSQISAAVSFLTSVTTTDGGNWLSVAPVGTNPAGTNTSSSINITVNPTGLTGTSYNGMVILNYGPSYTPLQIPVSFSLAVPPVTLSGPSSMGFAYTLGDAAPPSSQMLNISASGSATLNAAVTSGNSWLSVSPASGAAPASFTVTVNTAGLTAQTYSGNIQITAANATNSPFNVPVSFVVSPSTLTVPTALLTFNYTIGTAAPTAQNVSITGTAGISFTATPGTTSGGSWLSATSGVVPSSTTVSIKTTGLTTPGQYSGSVTVTSTGATGSGAVIPVTLNVIAPTLTAAPSSLNFAYQLGSATQPASQPISVGDASNVNFTATPATTSGGPWLSVTPGNGSASGSIGASVNTAGLPAGVYTGTVTISATGATSQVVNVTLTVASVLVSTNSLSYGFQIGGTVPGAQTVNVGGTLTLGFTATPATTSGGSWLSVTPTSGTITPSSTVSISVNTTGLTANTYMGTVTIAAPGAVSQVINVTLNVSNTATISASPSSLSFNYTLGGTAPAAQPISVGGSAGVGFSATPATTSGGSWLSVTPTSGTISSSVSVSVNTTGLSAGTYSGSVTVAATGVSGVTPQVVNVSLTITSTVTATPSPLNFAYTLGGTAPAAQSLMIGGTATAFTGSATTTSGGSWLSVTPSGAVPGTATVSVTTTGLAVGTYNGTVTIGATGATSVGVPVTLVVSNNLTASPTTLSFTYTIGGTAPAAQSLTIGGTSGITFSTAVTTTTGGSWLSASAASPGTVAGSAGVSVTTTGLAAGTYKGSVTISAPNATAVVVPVTLVVNATLTASPTSLSFTYTVGGTAPAAQTLTIGGTSGVAFTAAASGGTWLAAATVSPSTVPGAVNVSIVTTGLTAGTYNGNVTIASTGATSVVVPVTLVASGKITVKPASLTFNYVLGSTLPAVQAVTVGGTAGATFTVGATTATGAAWLSATPVSPGTVPGIASVGIITTAVTTPGTYTGTVTIGAAGETSQTVSVTLNVTTAPITVSPASISFNYVIGGAALLPQPLNVLTPVGYAYTATVGSGASWLSVSPGSGTLGVLLSVTANPAGLTAGKYNSTVTITAAGVSNSPFSVPVTLNVSNATTTISVSNSALSFTAITGSTTISSQNVNVTSATPTAVAVSTQGSAWLTASISGATTPAVVTVSVNPSNLTAGSYTGTVAVTAASATDSPQNISVKFVVSAPPSLTVTPASLSFAYTLGGAAPAAQSISVTATQQVGIATSITNGAWLTINNSSASTPANLTVSVNPAGLTAGTYNATITIAGIGTSNSPQTAAVTLVVSGPPTFSGSPSSLTFTAQSGAASPAAQSISLTGGSTLQFAVATAPSWLSVSASANTTPATLVATVNSKGMAQGTYQGTITITNSAAGNSPYVIPVTLTLSAPQVAAGPLISSVVNAASYATTGFSPGAILSIFGSLLGPQTGVSFTVNSQGGLDTTLSGTTVTVGGLLAIPLFVQNGQVNVILPYTLATSGPATVTVEYNNLASAAFNIQLSPADVQIFTANASGSGPGSILNQDYSVNTVTNPAAPGSVVQVFGTGAGALNPSAPVIAGNVAVDNPLSWVSSQYSATVNGENAVVLYAGSAPGLVYGVDQFNVQLPADLPSGPQNIVLTVGASTSQTDVTVFVN